MTFHQQPFVARLAQMGDEAETAFDELNPNHHKLGINRPPMNVAAMNPIARYTPDRMLYDRLVECMGIGKDATLKLKVEKLDALFAWTWISPVDLFVHDSHQRRWWQAPLKDWFVACQQHAQRNTFPEGKEYYALRADHFPTEPSPYGSPRNPR
jgi:hypothetical protein